MLLRSQTKLMQKPLLKKFAHQESELNLDEWYVVEEIPLRGEIK